MGRLDLGYHVLTSDFQRRTSQSTESLSIIMLTEKVSANLYVIDASVTCYRDHCQITRI